MTDILKRELPYQRIDSEADYLHKNVTRSAKELEAYEKSLPHNVSAELRDELGQLMAQGILKRITSVGEIVTLKNRIKALDGETIGYQQFDRLNVFGESQDLPRKTYDHNVSRAKEHATYHAAEYYDNAVAQATSEGVELNLPKKD